MALASNPAGDAGAVRSSLGTGEEGNVAFLNIDCRSACTLSVL